MRKLINILCLFGVVLSASLSANADNRQSLGNGVNIVQYGNTWVIEDDNRQMSISMEIAQAGIDKKNNEMMYKVVCEGYTKKVAKWALKAAIKEGIKHAVDSGGSSLLVSVSGYAVDIIYDGACNYWKEKGGY